MWALDALTASSAWGSRRSPGRGERGARRRGHETCRRRDTQPRSLATDVLIQEPRDVLSCRCSNVPDLLCANQLACAKEEVGCSRSSIKSWGWIPARAMLGWCLTVYSGEGYAAMVDENHASQEGDRAGNGLGS